MQDLPTSLCANLIAEACNIGLEPLTRNDVLALRRARLSWVSQNFIRNETLVEANSCLVAEQNKIAIGAPMGRRRSGLRGRTPLRGAGADTARRAESQILRLRARRDLLQSRVGSIHRVERYRHPWNAARQLYLLAVVLEQQTELHPVEI